MRTEPPYRHGHPLNSRTVRTNRVRYLCKPSSHPYLVRTSKGGAAAARSSKARSHGRPALSAVSGESVYHRPHIGRTVLHSTNLTSTSIVCVTTPVQGWRLQPRSTVNRSTSSRDTAPLSRYHRTNNLGVIAGPPRVASTALKPYRTTYTPSEPYVGSAAIDRRATTTSFSQPNELSNRPTFRL